MMTASSRSVHGGIFVINKRQGMTSHDVCAAVKRYFRFKKVGHVGTLDPLATGVLPICVNEATKLVQFLIHQDKEYCCTMQLGVSTDTHDSHGTICEHGDPLPRDPELIRQTIDAFRGELWQTPPMFSAVKRNGVPLYRLARTGATVERKPRRIMVKDIEILAIELPQVIFRVVCSAGTYVRTLCHDIGQRLGCGAHMTALERIRNGSFHLSKAVSLEQLIAVPREQAIEQYLLPMTMALCGLPEVTVSDAVAHKLRTGAPVTVGDIRELCIPQVTDGQKLKVVSCHGQLIGIVAPLPPYEDDGMPAWKTLRVFAG